MRLAEINIFSDVYDCRYQGQSPFRDSPTSQVIINFVDLDQKLYVVHNARYADTKATNPYRYEISTKNSATHSFEQFFYDLKQIQETANFVRFLAGGASGTERAYVLDKRKKLLVYEDPLTEELKAQGKELGLSDEWLKRNATFSWERQCKLI